METPELSRLLLRTAVLSALYPALTLISPFGGPITLGLFVASAAAFWAAAEARGFRGRMGGGLFALLLSLGGAFSLGESTGAVAGAAVALGALRRSEEVFRLRSVIIEGALATLALLLFRWLVGPTPLTAAIAIWGFFLLQCCGALAMSPRRERPPERNAFRVAQERFDALLREL